MICIKCNQNKPKTDFRLGRKWCQDCRILYAKLHYRANKQKYSDNAKSYYQTHKEQILTAANNYHVSNKTKVKSKIKAYRLANKERYKKNGIAYREANKEQIKKYRTENKEKSKKYMKVYSKVNAEKYRLYARKRKTLKLKNIHEPYIDNCIFERDDWICQICGRKINKRLKWPNPLSKSIDHIIPLVKGGNDSPINVQAAHLRCNLSKHAGNGGQLRLIG